MCQRKSVASAVARHAPSGSQTGGGKQVVVTAYVAARAQAARTAEAHEELKGGWSMLRNSKFLALTTLAAALSLMVVWAASATEGAHFMSATSAVNNVGKLVVTFDEAGVGQQTVDLSLTANGNATYACLNGGGNHPKAANKESVTGPVSGSGSFAPTKNGRVSGSLEAGPPASNLTCPSGQTFVIACVSYTNIVLSDLTNGASTPVADVSRTIVSGIC